MGDFVCDRETLACLAVILTQFHSESISHRQEAGIERYVSPRDLADALQESERLRMKRGLDTTELCQQATASSQNRLVSSPFPRSGQKGSDCPALRLSRARIRVREHCVSPTFFCTK